MIKTLKRKENFYPLLLE